MPGKFDQDAVDEAVRVIMASLEPRIAALEAAATATANRVERQVVTYAGGGSDTYVRDPSLSVT